jgi:UDP:flavonoid glycosyltransferase YjiC (YdhE family)
VRQVLADGRYREQARRFQAEMAALPGPDRVVDVLEALAVRHEPIRAWK